MCSLTGREIVVNAQQTEMGRLLSEESPDTLVTNPGPDKSVGCLRGHVFSVIIVWKDHVFTTIIFF